MNKEISDYLIKYGFTIDNLKELVELPKWADGNLFKLDYYKHKGHLCSETLYYYIYIPKQGYISIFQERDSSYGYWLNKMDFHFDSLDNFKIVLNSII